MFVFCEIHHVQIVTGVLKLFIAGTYRNGPITHKRNNISVYLYIDKSSKIC